MIPSVLVTIAEASRSAAHAPPSDSEVQIWWHYEEIAMHFNSLLIQYRLQVMGGAGAIGAITGYLIGEKVKEVQQRRALRFGVAAGLWVLLLAAAIVDLGYYNRMLEGAVDALRNYEGAHPGLGMSNTIHHVVRWGAKPVWAAYALLLLVLGSYVCWTGAQWWTERRRRSSMDTNRTQGPREAI